ncbi:5'-nucleotidase C-terminal domain-containing protein [Asanoa ishikariensis]|uniref:5'-nucleotidase C-terminal domain-containing protein n=1 Tax=Asanoa ishikariensis TaxID=137265 RepID=UPI0015A29D93|nr:5'-nucleotidase C-terminal domain-containing protein [Asanoa ishikariensis]
MSRTVIGVLGGPLTRRQNPAGESTLGAVVADALQTGAKPFDLNVATLVDLDDLHADLGKKHGELMVGDALEALPMKVGSSVLRLTGAELHQALEAQFAKHGNVMQVSSQLAYQWRSKPVVGLHVDPTTITIGGKVVDPVASYVIAVSDGLRDRADKHGKVRKGSNPVIAAAPLIVKGVTGVGGAHPGPLFDNLAAYLATRNPLAVPVLGRITLVSR